MKILVLNPGARAMNYYLYSMNEGLITCAGINNYRGMDREPDVMSRIKDYLVRMQAVLEKDTMPETIAIRVFYGGNFFKGPAMMTEKTVAELKKLIPAAPFHIPQVLELANEAKQVFPGVDIVFVFETAFFTGLPERERCYAVGPDITRGITLQRLGFHGILHEIACRQAAAHMYNDGFEPPAKTLSICLEPRPEAAAAIGLRPIMATGGATPLEGLAGDTSCGDLDAGIIIKLARELKWGPEQINKVLTSESGVSGMLKRRTNLGQVFESDKRDCRLVQDFILYRLLQVAGAAIAAMGTIDYIIFSGKYGDAGKKIGPWLVSKLGFMRKKRNEPKLSWHIMGQTVEEIIAETANMAVIEMRNRPVTA